VAIPSGVPTAELQVQAPARAHARARLGVRPGDFLIVGVGRLVWVKGFDVLIAALPGVVAEVPSARAILVGEGPERAALDGQAAALGVGDRLRLGGAADAAGLLESLAAADVCVAPSRNEGMGRALVEAMALGLPVVGSAVGGIPSVIGPDEAGRLIPPDDPQALTAALVELGRDPILRAKVAEAARVRAAQFSTTVADARLLDLYAALARDKGLQ
jgi:glycosyltransferase involved in cell wall biosynthesis